VRHLLGLIALPDCAEMLFTRSVRSLSLGFLVSPLELPALPSFLSFFFFLQNFFLHRFFFWSGADVDASSLPRTPPSPHTADEQQHAHAPRRSFLPSLPHLLAADENMPIAGSTREWGGTLGPIHAGRAPRICWRHFYSGEGGGIRGREWHGFMLFLDVSWKARAKFGKA
jgi:hypothetical protein